MNLSSKDNFVINQRAGAGQTASCGPAVHSKLSSGQGGYVALITVIFLGAILIFLVVDLGQIRRLQQIGEIDRFQARLAWLETEACAEEVVLKKVLDAGYSGSEALNFGESTCFVGAEQTGAEGERILTLNSQGRGSNIDVQLTFRQGDYRLSLRQAAQAGTGGMRLGNNTQINGDAMSNSDILPLSGVDQGSISGETVIAGETGLIKDMTVGAHLSAANCEDVSVGGNFYTITGGSRTNCTISGTIFEQSSPVGSQPYPISQNMIDSWKQDAANGGTISGLTVDSGSQSVGPIKINGDLKVRNNATLVITGTIWVTGDASFKNNATVKLDQSFGQTSGVLIADGEIEFENNAVIEGSSGGNGSSWILFLSTADKGGVGGGDGAISFSSNTVARDALFFAPNGLVELKNNADVSAVIGETIILDNNAVISFSEALGDLFLSSSGGQGFVLSGWEAL